MDGISYSPTSTFSHLYSGVTQNIKDCCVKFKKSDCHMVHVLNLGNFKESEWKWWKVLTSHLKTKLQIDEFAFSRTTSNFCQLNYNKFVNKRIIDVFKKLEGRNRTYQTPCIQNSRFRRWKKLSITGYSSKSKLLHVLAGVIQSRAFLHLNYYMDA